MSEAISGAHVMRAQNRKRACCSQPESSTRTKRKPRAGKKKAADTVASTSASTNTVDTANANASASTNTTTNTVDTSVSTRTQAPTSETSGEEDAKIRQRKATLHSRFRVFSLLIYFCSVIDNSTRTTVFNPIDNNQRALSSLPREN